MLINHCGILFFLFLCYRRCYSMSSFFYVLICLVDNVGSASYIWTSCGWRSFLCQLFTATWCRISCVSSTWRKKEVSFTFHTAFCLFTCVCPFCLYKQDKLVRGWTCFCFLVSLCLPFCVFIAYSSTGLMSWLLTMWKVPSNKPLSKSTRIYRKPHEKDHVETHRYISKVFVK